MLSLGLFLNFEKNTYGKYIIDNASRSHLYVGLNKNKLNPNAETFFPQMPARACGPTSPLIYENSDSDSDNDMEKTNSNCSEHVVNESEIGVLDQLRTIKIKNPKKVILGHLNINSIPNKFEGIMGIVKNQLDVFLISETKIDDSFPDAQFYYNGYSKPYRQDRIYGAGGGLLMYVNENIPSRKLNEHNLPEDVEIMCIEINLKKQKWVLIGIYRPPDMNETYFLDELSKVIDLYSKRYDRIVIMGDFNSEPSDKPIETFCDGYNLHNLVKENIVLKAHRNATT